MITFTERAWKEAQPIMARICAHPFLQEMAAGTLSRNSFKTYLEQDCIYVANYGDEFMRLAHMLPKSRMQELFLQFAQEGIAAEDALHQMLMTEFGGTDAQPLQGTLDYINHTRQYFNPEDLPMAMAAMLPCMWVYNEVGKYILSIEKDAEHNPYHEWISCYASDLMEEGVKNALELINTLASNELPERQNQMLKAFLIATEMEYIFWNQAYSPQKMNI